jgi:protein gp37
MADQRDGGISWTDETLNFFRGCSRISAGCANCYAEDVAGIRLSKPGQKYEGLAVMKNGQPTWTGKVVFDEKVLVQAARWRRGRKLFACSMSDVFHESNSVDDLARAFAYMQLTPRHTYQVLTKRALRMRQILERESFADLVSKEAERILSSLEAPRMLLDEEPLRTGEWPIKNVWLGVSVENQGAADERIPELLATPAAVRWLSVEPLIGRVSFSLMKDRFVAPKLDGAGIDWVVVGGESGAGHRAMDVEWARSLKHDCAQGGIAFWMKQLGGHPTPRKMLEDFPEDLRVREFPQVRER